MPAAVLLAPLAMAVLLALSAVAKTRDPEATLSAMRLLRLPAVLTTEAVARSLPWLEWLIVAGLLLAPAGPVAVTGGLAAAALMATYWLVVARALTFTPRPVCSCFGRIGNHPVSWRTVLRNTLLVVAAAVWLAATVDGASVPGLLSTADAGTWWWLLGVGLLAALAALVLAPPRVRAVAASGAAEAVGAEEYVRVPIPAATLLDPVAGPDGARTLRELAAERPQLLVFVTCGCSSTEQAAEQIPEWRARIPAVDVRAVTVLPYAGLVAAVPAIAPGLLLDHGGSAYLALGLAGTPVAVLLGADGLLAGGPVTGVADIADLVEQIAEVLAEAQPAD